MKIKRFMCIAVCFLLCINFSLFIACAEEKSAIAIVSPKYGETISVLYENQLNYWLSENGDVRDYIDITQKDNSKPKPTVLEWSGNGVDEYYVYFSDSPYFVNVEPIITRENKIMLYNLYKGQNYYWKVTSADSSVSTEVSCFITSDVGPRPIDVECLYNVRDLGGYTTIDGGRVKQGMVFRGSEMNHFHFLTLSGKKTMANELKIKTDLDFRPILENGGYYISPLEGDVNYVNAPIIGYTHEEDLDVKVHFANTFKVFVNQDNYPVYMHCYAGADRTGIVSFMLNALLGVPYDTLVKDYEFTSFSAFGLRDFDDNMKSVYNTIKSYGGETLQEQTENYMKSYLGLTPSELEKIKFNLIEK